MTPQTSDMQSVLERLDKLERQNRRVKQLALAALLPIGAVLLMGQCTPRGRTVEAEKFIVRDPRGRLQAEFASTEYGPALSLYDKSGKARVGLDAAAAPGLKLYDPSGWPQAELTTQPEGAFLSLSGTDGHSSVLGCLGLVTPTPSNPLGLAWPKEKAAPCTASSLIMFGKDGKVIWRAP